MALDPGVVNIIAGIVTDGFSFLVPGGELLALDRYFHKEKTRCTKSTSKRCVELNTKWGRQRSHCLHALTRWLVDMAVTRSASTILVGELKGIRRDKDWGARATRSSTRGLSAKSSAFLPTRQPLPASG